MKSVLRGISIAVSFWPLAIIILLIQLAFGLVVGSQVGSSLSEVIGFSKAGELFSQGFDYAVYQDMLKAFPDALADVQRSIPIVIIAYLLISIFLHGGLIRSIITNQRSWSSFMKNGLTYFLPFLLIGFTFLILFLLLTAILWAPVLINALNIIESIASDRLFFYLLYVIGIIYLLGLSLLVSASVNSRINYAVVNESIFSSLKAGFAWTLKKYLPLTCIFSGFSLLSFLLLCCSIKLDTGLGLNVWLSFLTTLVFIIFRILVRSSFYATLMHYCEAIVDEGDH